MLSRIANEFITCWPIMSWISKHVYMCDWRLEDRNKLKGWVCLSVYCIRPSHPSTHSSIIINTFIHCEKTRNIRDDGKSWSCFPYQEKHHERRVSTHTLRHLHVFQHTHREFHPRHRDFLAKVRSIIIPTHGCTQDPQILEKAKCDSETGSCAEESTSFGYISKW